MADTTAVALSRDRTAVASPQQPNQPQEYPQVWGAASLEALIHALRILSENSVIQDLQLNGILSPAILLVLKDVLQRDFSGLQRLQVTVRTEHLNLAQGLVDAAKLRSYSAYKQGVSVYIDQV